MPQTEEIIADEVLQGKYSVLVLHKKYLKHQQNPYHVFIDFKKAFDSVWHKVLYEMNKYNLGKKIQQLFKVSSTVLFQLSIGKLSHIHVSLYQNYLVSPTLF